MTRQLAVLSWNSNGALPLPWLLSIEDNALIATLIDINNQATRRR